MNTTMPTLKKDDNILKSRDDGGFVVLSKNADGTFSFPQGNPAWHKSDKPLEPEKLRERIEPWLTSLFQSEHLSLLIGSGLTRAVGDLAACNDLPAMDKISFRGLQEANQYGC